MVIASGFSCNGHPEQLHHPGDLFHGPGDVTEGVNHPSDVIQRYLNIEGFWFGYSDSSAIHCRSVKPIVRDWPIVAISTLVTTSSNGTLSSYRLLTNQLTHSRGILPYTFSINILIWSKMPRLNRWINESTIKRIDNVNETRSLIHVNLFKLIVWLAG